MEINHEILSDIVVWNKYAKYLKENQRRETWSEIVTRNMEMHIRKFPNLEKLIRTNYELVFEKKVLPSMRSMQFGGKPIEVNNARIFNCSYLHIDDYRAFNETMFLLLSGTGVGYSLSRNHINKLPKISKSKKYRRYLIADNIEGWADAVKVLMKSYFGLSNWKPDFDFRSIRAKGERLITSGGVAPGPEPLKICLAHIETILEAKQEGEQLTSLECHDILCHIANAVLAGGIRRSAMIALFDYDDEDMLTCKSGEWYYTNPQRARANNSVKLLRNGAVNKQMFLDLWKKVEDSNAGEPGFYFTNDLELGTNPCAEIALNSCQFCNLVEINASDIKDQWDFEARAETASFIGTLQASYTDFHYLRPIWKEVTEREALLGVGMTGIASGKVLELDMTEAAEATIRVNSFTAAAIGINPAARITTVKPSGTASIVLGCSSGIHVWHSDFYLRRMRVGKNEALYTYLAINHPELIEDNLGDVKEAYVCVPIAAPKGSITRASETAIEFLERVKLIHEKWIKPGHIYGDNTHNVSATVTMKPNEWGMVGEWLWDNQNHYNGLSFMPEDLGSYKQTPYEEIDEATYMKLSQSLTKLDVTKIVEMDDNTNLLGESACAGGNCEII